MLKTEKAKRKIGRIQPRKKTNETLDASEQQNSNLCRTCNFKDNCTLSSSNAPILHCEEFDNSNTSQRQSTRPNISTEENIIQYEQHMGLCANCVHKDTCSLSKIEGGVWHCEEYA
jgi:hypothetical protein